MTPIVLLAFALPYSPMQQTAEPGSGAPEPSRATPDSPAAVGAPNTPSWDELVYRAIHHRSKGEFLRAADAFRRAAELKRQDNAQEYWDAAIQYSRGGNLDASFAALDLAIDAGIVDVQRLLSHPRLDGIRADGRWAEAVARMRDAEAAYTTQLSHPRVRAELLDMWRADQDLVGQGDLQAEVIRANTERLKEIVGEIGWPTIPAVGRDGSWAAWAIAQHSADVRFQRQALRQIAEAVETRAADPAHYAELHDRIRRNLKLEQIFGMATMAREGVLRFYPIQDEHDVDVRRAAIGLPPLRVFAHASFIEYQRPSRQATTRREEERRTRALLLYQDAVRSLDDGGLEDARLAFDEALEVYGALTDEQVYEFAAAYASASGAEVSSPDKLHDWLRLLIDREWFGRSRILFDARFDSRRRDGRWRGLMEELKASL